MPRTKTIEARSAYHTSHVLAPRQTNSIDIEPLGPPSRAEPAEYAWGLPERIDRMDPENSVQEATELAANRSGSAIAVWMDWNGGVWTNHYTDSKGWGTSEQIEANATEGGCIRVRYSGRRLDLESFEPPALKQTPRTRGT